MAYKKEVVHLWSDFKFAFLWFLFGMFWFISDKWIGDKRHLSEIRHIWKKTVTKKSSVDQSVGDTVAI